MGIKRKSNTRPALQLQLTTGVNFIKTPYWCSLTKSMVHKFYKANYWMQKYPPVCLVGLFQQWMQQFYQSLWVNNQLSYKINNENKYHVYNSLIWSINEFIVNTCTMKSLVWYSNSVNHCFQVNIRAFITTFSMFSKWWLCTKIAKGFFIEVK